MLPLYEPSATGLGTHVSFDPKTGTLIAMKLGNALEDSIELPLTLAKFTYGIPKGSIVAKKRHTKTRYGIMLRPPGGFLDRLKASRRINLLVFPYSEETITDVEQFKRSTYVNLAGRHDCRR